MASKIKPNPGSNVILCTFNLLCHQTKPNHAMYITTVGYTVLVHSVLLCSKPVYTDKKIIQWWCGGGAVYLNDYITTPV